LVRAADAASALKAASSGSSSLPLLRGSETLAYADRADLGERAEMGNALPVMVRKMLRADPSNKVIPATAL